VIYSLRFDKEEPLFTNYCVNKPCMNFTVAGRMTCLRNELETTLTRKKNFSTVYLNYSIMNASAKRGFVENLTSAFRFQGRERISLFPHDRT
jgi:hypothetical protein